MQYRREIDGLRAVAVIPVVLFHAGLSTFRGGFVGVDVFFVISGYLITSILMGDLAAGKFSIARFYERRARRILPALFAVIVACLPFAWLWMSPSQIRDFAQSIISVIFFVSNILFWHEQGYFAAAAELKPLLHTWSLAVEEQYYVFFPPALALLWRLGKQRAFLVLAAVALVSLVASEWGSRNAASANFYLAPSRTWELLAGSMCAFIISARGERPHGLLSAVGILLIVLSILYFDDSTPFPSFYALAPVVGTALIILFATSQTWTGRLLGTPALVGIGLISYSAYLWHQPLLAFARLRSVSEPALSLMLGLSFASFALAYLSWRYIERPFRKPGSGALPTRRGVFACSAMASALLITVALVTQLEGGFPERSSTHANFADLDARIAPNYGFDVACVENFTLSPDCATKTPPEMVLWGDSYAMHLVEGMIASDRNLGIRQHTQSSCAPILGMSVSGPRFNATWSRHCIAFNDQVLSWLEEHPEIRYVILSTAFGILDEDIFLRDGRILKDADNAAVIAKGLMETARQIRAHGRKVVIFSPTAEHDEDIGQCLVRATFFGASERTCDFPRASIHNRTEFALLARVAATVPVIRIDDMICGSETCDTIQDGHFIYRDDGHLSKEGSAYLGRKFGWANLARRIAR